MDAPPQHRPARSVQDGNQYKPVAPDCRRRNGPIARRSRPVAKTQSDSPIPLNMGAITFSLDESLAAFLAGQLPIQIFVETGAFRGDSL